uniref:Uncharacterized protein n=1 Tax=Anguilla anguilla TaxID=7936 RepID=A0A0E9V748_ANGAN
MALSSLSNCEKTS